MIIAFIEVAAGSAAQRTQDLHVASSTGTTVALIASFLRVVMLIRLLCTFADIRLINVSVLSGSAVLKKSAATTMAPNNKFMVVEAISSGPKKAS